MGEVGWCGACVVFADGHVGRRLAVVALAETSGRYCRQLLSVVAALALLLVQIPPLLLLPLQAVLEEVLAHHNAAVVPRCHVAPEACSARV